MYNSRRLLTTINSRLPRLAVDNSTPDPYYANTRAIFHFDSATGSILANFRDYGSLSAASVTGDVKPSFDIVQMNTDNLPVTGADLTNDLRRSVYFDGNNDYITYDPGPLMPNPPFTISFWFKPNPNGTKQTIFRSSNGAATSNLNYEMYIDTSNNLRGIWYTTGGAAYSALSAAPTSGEWNYYIGTWDAAIGGLHQCVLIRSNGTASFFWRNGDSTPKFSASLPATWPSANMRALANSKLTVGAGWNGADPFVGHICNLRITTDSSYSVGNNKCIIPRYSNTGVINYTTLGTDFYAIPVAAWSAATGVLLDAKRLSLVDNSPRDNEFFVRGGPVQINTTVKRFGAASFYFNGTSYLYGGDTDIANLGTINWTIEFSVRFNAVQNSLLWASTSNTASPIVRQYIWFRSGALVYGYTTTSSPNDLISYSWTPETNRWYSIAVVRQGTNIFLFLEGALLKKATVSAGLSITSDSYWYIGGINTTQYPGSHYLNGYMEEFRFTRTTARYSRDYTVRSTAFPDS